MCEVPLLVSVGNLLHCFSPRHISQGSWFHRELLLSVIKDTLAITPPMLSVMLHITYRLRCTLLCPLFHMHACKIHIFYISIFNFCKFLYHIITFVTFISAIHSHKWSSYSIQERTRTWRRRVPSCVCATAHEYSPSRRVTKQRCFL